jgi:hypothetical protein
MLLISYGSEYAIEILKKEAMLASATDEPRWKC